MKHLTTASIPVALGAMVLASALSVQGSTITNNWFDAGISGADFSSLTGNGWTKAATDQSTVDTAGTPKSIALNTQGELLTYAPGVSTEGTNSFVDLSIKFVAADEDPDMTDISNTAKASLAVRKEGNDLYYIAYSGGSWIRMYGADPVTNSFVNVRVEMTLADNNSPLVSYLVEDNGAYVRLTDAATSGSEWVAFAKDTQSRSVASISFSGAGNVSALSGQYYYEIASLYVVTVDNVPDTPIVLTQAWLDAHPTLTTPAAINAFLADTGANGLPNWKSYVLGLESESAPIWVGTANGDSTKITIKMNGPAAEPPQSGIAVTYRLQKYVNDNENEPWQTVGSDQSSPSFSLSLDDDPTGKYRVLAIFTAQ